MEQKVELIKVRSTQEVIDDSILFIKQNLKPLLKAYYLICGFFVLAGIVIAGFFQVYFGQVFTTGRNGTGSSFYLIALIEMLNFLFVCLTSVCYMALYIAKDNIAPTVDEVWSYVKFYFSRMAIANALLFIGLSIATVLCVFPGVYLWPILCLVPVIMMLENTSLSYALGQAFKLLKNNWGDLFGLLFITVLLMLAAGFLLIIPVMLVSVGVVFLIGNNHLNIAMIALNIAIHLAQVLSIFPFIVISFYYFSLTDKHGSGSLLTRIEMIGLKKSSRPITTAEEEEY